MTDTVLLNTEYLRAMSVFVRAKQYYRIAGAPKPGNHVKGWGTRAYGAVQLSRSPLEGAAVAPEHVAIALEEYIAFESSSANERVSGIRNTFECASSVNCTDCDRGMGVVYTDLCGSAQQEWMHVPCQKGRAW